MADETEDFFKELNKRSVDKARKFNYKKIEKPITNINESETSKPGDSIEDELEAIFHGPLSNKKGNTTRNNINVKGETFSKYWNKTSSEKVDLNKSKFNFNSGVNKNVNNLNVENKSEFKKQLTNKTVNSNKIQTKLNLTNLSKTHTSAITNFTNVPKQSTNNSSDKLPTHKMSPEKSTLVIKESNVKEKNSSKFKFKKNTAANISAAIFESLFGETDQLKTHQTCETNVDVPNGTVIDSYNQKHKIVPESINNEHATEEKNTKVKNSFISNCSYSSNDSPVIKQKKFNFKKPLISDTSTSKSPTDSPKDSVIAIDSTENSPVIQQKPLHKDVSGAVQQHSNNTLNSDVGIISQSLAASEDDYMDDETFEKIFGANSEKINEIDIDLSAVKWEDDDIIEEASSSNKDYEQEISCVDWDEDIFDEKTPTISFKGREDNSDEFQKRYHFSDVMDEVLHQKFGLQTFRPQQREIINATLNRHDCFVLMPTGGGKSLCYQLPAILSEGVSIVISPLRALISDQVDKMNGLDIPAAHLCQDVSKDETDRIIGNLLCREPVIKLLYLTPEKIMASRVVSNMLKHLYQKGKLARFIIDEAHCLSQWGHDFRPDYKKLLFLKNEFKDVPIMCLTATATKQVESDVINTLKLKNVKRFIMSFNRPNIKYQVIPKKGKLATNEIVHLVKKIFPNKSGIVYCLTRNDCESLADILTGNGIKTRPYHAGMSDKIREAVQREWMQDRFFIIVATVAFGMGIDKPDVRFVIHNSIPKSVESFYQESGRAGRDGDISYSYLFYNYSDVVRLQKIMRLERTDAHVREGHSNNLRQMVSFAENVVDCRRYLQLIHLGENFNRQLCIQNKATICDNCENIDTYSNVEVTKEARDLGTLVNDLSSHGNVTLLHVAEVYKGSKLKKILDKGHNRHHLYGNGSAMNKNDIHRILKDLVMKHILNDHVVCTGEFPIVYIKPGKQFRNLHSSNLKIEIPVNSKSVNKTKIKGEPDYERFEQVVKDAPGPSKPLPVTVAKAKNSQYAKFNKTKINNLKVECHEALLEECRKMALERNLTLSSIMNLTAIKIMSDVLPKTKEEFLKIQHVTIANYKKCGENFLAITSKFRDQVDSLEVAPKLSQASSFNSSVDEDDWCSTSQPTSSFRGTKRKWTGGGKKRTKRSKYAGKKKSPKKTKATKGIWKGKGGKSGGGGGGAGGGLGLMPVHFK